MEDGLGHAVEEEAGADPTGEQHGKPGGVVVFWLTTLPPQRQAAVLQDIKKYRAKEQG